MSGIAPSVWASESDTIIETALDILSERAEHNGR